MILQEIKLIPVKMTCDDMSQLVKSGIVGFAFVLPNARLSRISAVEISLSIYIFPSD